MPTNVIVGIILEQNCWARQSEGLKNKAELRSSCLHFILYKIRLQQDPGSASFYFVYFRQIKGLKNKADKLTAELMLVCLPFIFLIIFIFINKVKAQEVSPRLRFISLVRGSPRKSHLRKKQRPNERKNKNPQSRIKTACFRSAHL